MLVSTAHIAGIAVSEGTSSGINKLAISAGTKALLDAGVTFSDVDVSVAGFTDDIRIPQSSFDSFGQEGAPVIEVDSQSALFTAIQTIRSRQTNCTLVVALDKSSDGNKLPAVGIVLVSDLFLTARAYLKDSAIRVQSCMLASRAQSQKSGGPNHFRTLEYTIRSALRQAGLQPTDVQAVQVQQGETAALRQVLGNVQGMEEPASSSSPQAATGTTGLVGLAELDQLRGWAQSRPLTGVKNSMQFASSPNGSASVILLTRSDGRPAPEWNDIKDVREGRERLGYNPADESRDITGEDLEAVRARRGYNSGDLVKRLQLPPKGGDRAALARL